MFVWIVSFLLERSLKFEQFNFIYYEIHKFFVKKLVKSNDIWLNITVSIC